MSFEIQGQLHKKFDTEQVKDTFKKREFILEIESGAYSQLIKFQLVQDKCSAIEDYNEGDTIKVFFDLRGRAWTGRDGRTSYFTNLQAWKVETVGANQPTTQPVQDAPPATNDFPSAADAPPAFNDDLPF